MLISSGNINQPYTVIGMVYAVVTREQPKAGCGKVSGLPVQKAYEAAGEALYNAAKASKGDGVINIGYDYRVASKTVGCNNNEKPLFEVYAWGTAVKLENTAS